MTCMHMCVAVCLHVRVLIHLSISERTCALNCFHLSPLSPTKDMVKFASSQWTLPGQPKVCCMLIASVFNYSGYCYLTFTGWSMLSLVLVCCPSSTSTPLSGVLVLLAIAMLHKVAYGVRICIVSISIDFFFSVQSLCLCRDSELVGAALHAGCSRSANSPRLLNERRGEATFAKHVCTIYCFILINSGSSLMLGMTLLQMHITLLCPAFLEGIVLAVSDNSIERTCMCTCYVLY